MLTRWTEGPFLSAHHLFFAEHIDHRLPREQIPIVNPGAEIGRNRHVRRRGDDAVYEDRVTVRKFIEDLSKSFLGGHPGTLNFRKSFNGDGGGCMTPPNTCIEWNVGKKLFDLLLGYGKSFEWLPFAAITNVHISLEGRHLVRRHNARMVVLVAGKRQAPTLDRVGDEAEGTVVLSIVECLDQG